MIETTYFVMDSPAKCKTLDGRLCAKTKCIGYCWSDLHRGYLTKRQMEEHQCIQKQCPRFQKFPEARFWKQKEAQIKQRKEGKEAKKRIAAEETEFLHQIQELTKDNHIFYPIAVDLKDNVYNIRFVSFGPVDYSEFFSLFRKAANGRKMYFSKIKTSDDRKKLLVGKLQNIRK